MPDGTSAQNEILRQLSEIQRSVGEVTATVAALREDMKDESHASKEYRESVNGKISNALKRIGQLEGTVSGLASTMEKTVQPLVEGANNNRQRVIGFLSAWTLLLSAMGVVGWLLFGGGLQQIMDFIVSLSRGR